MLAKRAAGIAVILLIIGVSVFSFYGQPTTPEEVTIFILDDFSRTGSLANGRQVSHGEIVKKVISTEVPEVTTIPYSVADKQGEIKQQLYFTGLRQVVRYAATHPDQQLIVNISLSFSANDNLHHQLIKQLSRQGVKIVAAAGNDDSDRPVYPAGYQEVIAVANANQTKKLADSNYGAYIDIAAPGSVEHIFRAYYPQGTGIKTLRAAGTSFSAPRVVGLLAELVINQPDLSLEGAWEIIVNTAQPIKSALYEAGNLGVGVIDQPKALGQVVPGYQRKNRLLLAGGLGAIGLLLLGLLVKYRVAGIFFALLLLLVGLPLVVLTGQQFRWGAAWIADWAAAQDLGLITLISIAGSIGAALVATTWERSKLISSFFVLAVGGLIIGSQSAGAAFISWLFWGWTGILIGLEWGLVLYLQQLTNPQAILQFSCCPSPRIRELIKNKLAAPSAQVFPVLQQTLQEGSIPQQVLTLEVLAERRTEQAQDLIQQQLGTVPPPVGQAAVKGLLKFSPAPMSLVVVFAVEYDLSADKLLEWWPEISAPAIEALVELTQHQEQAVTTLAVEILGRLAPERVINKVKAGLADEELSDKESLLEVLIKIGPPAESALPKIVNIIWQGEDVWLRYKALRALRAIVPDLEEVMSLLQKLQEDSEELIRLEAEGIIEEAATNC